jgi:hypothetical protein
MIRIICNKKIELTEDEWKLYQEIAASYDEPPMTKGESLFQNLFETDDDGIIQFLRPPSQRYTSMEVFLFLVTVFQQQHARVIYGKLEELMNDVRVKLSEIEKR